MANKKVTSAAAEQALIPSNDVPDLDTALPAPAAEEPPLTAEASEAPVSNLDTAPHSDTEVEETFPLMAVVSAPNGLNLRQGPAVLFPVTAVLQNGDEVVRLPLPQGAEVPGWALVTALGVTGWVDARFLAWQES